MAVAHSKAAYYTHLPPQNYAVSPVYRPPRSRLRFFIACTVGLLLLLGIVYTSWPSDPELKIVRLRLKRIKVHAVPPISVDMCMLVTVKVRNADVYWMELKELDVAVRYRGKKLGHVESEHGHVKARGSSYVDGEMKVAGMDVPEMVFLVEDLARGAVPLHTVTQVWGQLGLLFFQVPFTFKAKLSCEVLVSTKNQTIIRQHCLRE